MFKLIKFKLINIWGINIYTIFFFLAHSASAPALLRRFEGNVARTDVHSLETMCSRAIHAIREKKEKLSLDAVFFHAQEKRCVYDEHASQLSSLRNDYRDSPIKTLSR